MKMSQKYCIHYWLIGAAAAASTTNLLAFEASDVLVFSHGPLSLRPQLGISEQFDDNIFYLDQNKQSDFITTFAPGLKLLLGQDLETENHVKLQYTLEQLLYADHTDQNATQHKFLTDTHFTKSRFTIDGADHYDMLSSILGGGFSIAKQKVDRTIWYDIYRFDYKVGQRMGVYIEGQHVETDYQTGLPLFDTRTLSGTGGFEYSLSEDTSLFGEVYYGETSLHSNAVSTRPPGTSFVGGFVGARGKFTEKINGTLKAGYEVSSFTGNVPAGSDKSAGSAPVVEANITYLATERLTTSLTYSRRQHVSVQFVSSSYVLDAITASATQVLGAAGRLRLDLLASYAMYSFDPAPAYPGGRSDTNWKVQAGASYFFQTWLSTRLEYSFEEFTSDFASVVDYDVNRVTLSLAIGY
ncbi:MAG TPA: outer membrane beta-barrel protein [Verrucomicrobiae bacterium]